MELIEYGLGKIGSFLYGTYYVNIHQTALGFAIYLALVLAVFAVELVYVDYGKSGFRRIFFARSKSTITDIVFFVLQTTGMIALFAAFSSLGLSYFITKSAQGLTPLNLGNYLPGWAHVILFLVLSDFLCYWQHRLMHWSPALWRLHEFHHAAEEFNALTAHREHPLEKAISMVVLLAPALVIGLPTGEFTTVLLIFGAVGFVKHSAIPWHGRFGKYVIQSARDHSVHHSKLSEHRNRNFANYFPIWDHMFATYYDGAVIEVELGLDRAYFNRSDPVRESIATEIRFVRRALKGMKTQVVHIRRQL
ncbi:sterol desaturase family protein [Mesorhizobium sp. CN2-181]|uniref:sterol desaturase family protein n=1 Tax=Mesorhizobium yinganensis TaxID=3157707 RepID=UPI0032B70A7D